MVQEMRQAGLRGPYAETISLAVRASEVAACVAVLRPDTWKTPSIATMMRAQPSYLLPVLAEPMELPRGPWTQAPISLAEEPGEAERLLIQELQHYLVTRPQTALARYQ